MFSLGICPLFLILFPVLNANFQGIHPDTYLTAPELIRKYGYPLEIHEITTTDGYMLTLIRIPHGKNNTEINQKPILLLHGLFGDAANFLIAGLNGGSLAYFFADRGYDVWLGNCRGTDYGQRHVKLDPKSPEFWKFSWHEMGSYDLPAMVDYILQTTRKSKLYYVGYSQGATSFYVLTSLKPEYRSKFIQASLMAPVGLMAHFDNVYLLPVASQHKLLTEIADEEEIIMFPPPWLNITAIMLMPNDTNLLKTLCVIGFEALFKVVMSEDSDLFDSRLYPLFAKFLQNGAMQQFVHYAQVIDTGHFRPFDYGKEKNFKMYGISEPLDYPVEQIDVPIALYYGLSDQANAWKDVEEMCNKLQNCSRKFPMKNQNWGHFDFIGSSTLAKELNEPLEDYMSQYYS